MIARILIVLAGFASESLSQILSQGRGLTEGSSQNIAHYSPYKHGKGIPMAVHFSYSERPGNSYSYGHFRSTNGIYGNVPFTQSRPRAAENFNQQGIGFGNQAGQVFQFARRPASSGLVGTPILNHGGPHYAGKLGSSPQITHVIHPHLLRTSQGFSYFLTEDANNQNVLQSSNLLHHPSGHRYQPVSSLQNSHQLLYASQPNTVHNTQQISYDIVPMQSNIQLTPQYPSSDQHNLVHFPTGVIGKAGGSTLTFLRPHVENPLLQQNGRQLVNVLSGRKYSPKGSGSNNHPAQFVHFSNNNQPLLAASSSEHDVLISPQGPSPSAAARNGQSAPLEEYSREGKSHLGLILKNPNARTSGRVGNGKFEEGVESGQASQSSPQSKDLEYSVLTPMQARQILLSRELSDRNNQASDISSVGNLHNIGESGVYSKTTTSSPSSRSQKSSGGQPTILYSIHNFPTEKH